ncbi:glycine betaine ABC transporter substrate-binding protein [Oscillatoria salina]|uniref:glycine betaine ABC transporter substrate-binding protein n=1 Tax=Oscillatoria salina TaxID=331517 RepID=UPI001CCEEEAC|nr:glycine betaine ABC transporter substrate-binding protein [Oscillatoria salina]
MKNCTGGIEQMKRLLRIFLSIVLASLMMFVVVACNNTNDNGAIKIGSKDFAEQLILGEMYAIALEENGLTVERKLNLGGTPIAQAGLVTEAIDFYPEYTGTALLTVLKLPINTNKEQVYETVSQAYADKYNLVWLEPSPMNNTQALVMTQAKSEQYGIKTIADLVANASELTLIGPPEFQGREDGLPGIKQAYGDFNLKAYKAVDPGLRYPGLINGEADVAVGFATDGEISANNLVVLTDTKNIFPPAQVAPVVNNQILEKNPQLKTILNQITAKITDETMQKLNYEVTGKNREPAEVAREFLLNEGLLTAK